MNYYVKRLRICPLILLLIVVNCKCSRDEFVFNELKELVDSYAHEGKAINNVLIPQERISHSSNNLIWKGILRDSDRTERTVAIKFITKEYLYKQELRAYERLNKNNDQTPEKNGIPIVYYSGSIRKPRQYDFFWEFYIIATTWLSESLYDIVNTYRPLHPENILRIIGQIIQTLHYMQQKIVIHKDLQPKNIMFRRGRAFIIDFSVSEFPDGNQDTENGNLLYGSIRYHSRMFRCYFDDLQSFFYIMLKIVKANLPWKNETDRETVGEIKMLRNTVRGLCDNITNEVVKEVYLFYHDFVMDPYPENLRSVRQNSTVPKYDELYKKVFEGLNKLNGSTHLNVDLSIENAIRNPQRLDPIVSKSVKRHSLIPEKLAKIFKHTDGPHPDIEKHITTLANKNETINKEIKPLKEGKLWVDDKWIVWHSKIPHQGDVGAKYATTLIVDSKHADSKNAKSKHTNEKTSKNAKLIYREYKMYGIMGAIKNESVEVNGIQSAYLFILNDAYTVTAYTLCEDRLVNKISKDFNGKISPANGLRALYQAIFTLKFVHGKGLIHQNLQSNCLLIRANRLYIADFEYSELHKSRYRDVSFGNDYFASPNYHNSIIRSYIDDLISLFYIILDLFGIELPWKGLIDAKAIWDMKINHDSVLGLLSKIGDPHVEEALLKFYKDVMPGFAKNRASNSENLKNIIIKPEYDTLAKYALDGIQKITQYQDQYFDWPLNNYQKEQAKKCKMPSIESIDGPVSFSIYYIRPKSQRQNKTN